MEMPVAAEGLKQLLGKALGPAKQNLDQYGKLLPVVLMFTEDGRQKTIPVPDKFQVGKTIEKEKPDAFVYVAEAWQRDATSEERKLNLSEVQTAVQSGGILGASESPFRREVIILIGGSGNLRVSLEQRFRRDRGKIVFDGVPEMKELKVGDSLVDWREEEVDNPSRLLTTAPSGGRIMHFDKPDFDMWIPEGWKMDWEPNATDPKRTPVWYREKNPHGGLRLRIHTYREETGIPRDPLGEARKEGDARRKSGESSMVLLDESAERPMLTYRFLAKGPQFDHPWMVNVFKVFDSKGAFELMWMSNVGLPESEVLKGLDSVKQIANRITRV